MYNLVFALILFMLPPCRNITMPSFLNLYKVFDTTDHSTLTARLHFFSSADLMVFIGHHQNCLFFLELCAAVKSISQGSIFGSLLFMMYTSYDCIILTITVSTYSFFPNDINGAVSKMSSNLGSFRLALVNQSLFAHQFFEVSRDVF